MSDRHTQYTYKYRMAVKAYRDSFHMQAACWLCGNPIRFDVGHNHPLAFTLDHAVSLAAGADPEDRSNWRPAHRRCNASKGARAHMSTTTKTTPLPTKPTAKLPASVQTVIADVAKEPIRRSQNWGSSGKAVQTLTHICIGRDCEWCARMRADCARRKAMRS